GLEKGKVDSTLVPFVSSLAYYAIFMVVIIAVLGAVGIQTASLVAVVGAAGLAIGLAMQGTLSHFASGVMLLVFRPFKVGDSVEAGGVAGSVKAIGIFTTTLTRPDNIAITIPNSTIWGHTITNYAANETRRIDLVMGISYSDNIQTAIDTMMHIMQADPRVLSDPEPTVAVSELADSSVNLVARSWCKRGDYGSLRSDLMRAFKEQLEAAGCSIPYPQQDVHMHQTGGERAA
ncbi:MAG: mechanosensitive ion channel domain-containing protein, partial [Gemmatimonadales bacterium]